MKTSIFAMSLIMSLLPLAATGEDRPQQEEFLRNELELIALDAEGLGVNHPQRLAVKKRTDELKKDSGIRGAAYFDLVRVARARLEEEQLHLLESGIGRRHPSFIAVESQLTEVKRIVESHMDPVNEARIENGVVYRLSVMGIPSGESKRWDDEYVLSEQGEFSLPLVGNVKVVGLSLREAEVAVEDALKAHEILTFPRVLLRPAQKVEQDAAPKSDRAGELED